MIRIVFFLALFFASGITFADKLPNNFVYLHDIDPNIIQEMRYYGYHNFMGRPVKGYEAPKCILTKPAAMALHQVQKKLMASHFSLKVYDCYRPQMAVNDFEQWSKNSFETSMKPEFYPRTPKNLLFQLGYIADYSGHTRGSTIDLTIVDITHLNQALYHPGVPLTACFSPARFVDNSIDMGTGFDCMDVTAHGNSLQVSRKAYHHRQYLRRLMEQAGFEPYEKEWWHFTLKKEPYPHQYFNFPVE